MATDVQPKPISIYPILSVNFVGTLGFSIVLPFLVFLVTRLGGNALIYGIMGATYSFFQLIGAPILGRLEVPPVAVPLPMLDPEPSVVPGVGAS